VEEAATDVEGALAEVGVGGATAEVTVQLGRGGSVE